MSDPHNRSTTASAADPGAARVLLITLSNIGDLVMTTPVLEALARHYPAAKIDIVADPRSSQLLSAVPGIGVIYERDKRAGFRAQARLVARLRQQHYTLVVDLRTRIVPWLLRAERRLFKPHTRIAEQHAVDDHFRALAALGLTAAPPCCIHLSDAARQQARQLLGLHAGQALVALAPGANWPGKRWSQANYHALLERLTDRFEAAVILGGRGDVEAPFDAAGAALPVIDLSARTDLLTAAAVLADVQAFVGNDSGLGHIAAALGVPTVTVFGPGDPARYAPRGPRTAVALAPGADLNRLDVAQVHTTLMDLLAQA